MKESKKGYMERFGRRKSKVEIIITKNKIFFLKKRGLFTSDQKVLDVEIFKTFPLM